MCREGNRDAHVYIISVFDHEVPFVLAASRRLKFSSKHRPPSWLLPLISTLAATEHGRGDP
jgi:hypothetical protein